MHLLLIKLRPNLVGRQKHVNVKKLMIQVQLLVMDMLHHNMNFIITMAFSIAEIADCREEIIMQQHDF